MEVLVVFTVITGCLIALTLGAALWEDRQYEREETTHPNEVPLPSAPPSDEGEGEKKGYQSGKPVFSYDSPYEGEFEQPFGEDFDYDDLEDEEPDDLGESDDEPDDEEYPEDEVAEPDSDDGHRRAAKKAPAKKTARKAPAKKSARKSPAKKTNPSSPRRKQ
ncbi:hypothetical protein [Streptomyces sp. NPDC007940]|uniref:hypothetical protein n=1 Tax=Streptomyces sp. NPDC007940 TaxID=3364796 RepID=UPI0036ED556D